MTYTPAVAGIDWWLQIRWRCSLLVMLAGQNRWRRYIENRELISPNCIPRSSDRSIPIPPLCWFFSASLGRPRDPSEGSKKNKVGWATANLMVMGFK